MEDCGRRYETGPTLRRTRQGPGSDLGDGDKETHSGTGRRPLEAHDRFFSTFDRSGPSRLRRKEGLPTKRTHILSSDLRSKDTLNLPGRGNRRPRSQQLRFRLQVRLRLRAHPCRDPRTAGPCSEAVGMRRRTLQRQLKGGGPLNNLEKRHLRSRQKECRPIKGRRGIDSSVPQLLSSSLLQTPKQKEGPKAVTPTQEPPFHPSPRSVSGTPPERSSVTPPQVASSRSRSTPSHFCGPVAPRSLKQRSRLCFRVV